MKSADEYSSTRKFLMLVLVLCGFAINLLLLIRHIAGGGIAGCGGGSSCEELLNSRWSQVLGLPVTGFGCLVYIGLLVSFTAHGRWLRNPCLGLIGGAAAWFVFVQALVIGRFCPWCMTAHGVGMILTVLGLWCHGMDGKVITAAKTMGLSAVIAVFGISVLQVYGPRPVTHRIANPTGHFQATAIHARGTGRKVEFDGGRKIYDVAALPHLGPVDAQRVMVEYFDYSCAACRTLRGYIDALLAKHPAAICVVVLPVPMERSCNHALAAGEPAHPGSCDLARLALAVWRIRPAEFAVFHQVVLDGVSAQAARAKALQLVPQEQLDAALQDPWIAELIQGNINDWQEFSTRNNKLPKLLISGKRILHGLPSGEADFIRVMETELGL
jgi:uncharacterized membrane protein